MIPSVTHVTLGQPSLVNFSRPDGTLFGDRRRAREPVQEPITAPGSSALLTLYTTSIGLAKRLFAGEELTRTEQGLVDDFPYQLAISSRGLIPATVERLGAARDCAVETGKGDLTIALGMQRAIRQLNKESTTGRSPTEQILDGNQSAGRIILA